MGSPYSGNANDLMAFKDRTEDPEALASLFDFLAVQGGRANDLLGGRSRREAVARAMRGDGRGFVNASAGSRGSRAGHSPSGGGGMGSSPVAKPQMRQARDYWRENYDHNFERENRRKDMDLEQMYKDKEMQNKLSMITNFLGSRGMKGGNVTESSTDEQFVNNAGAYQPVTTHSTSSRNILSDILGRLF